MSNKVKAFAEIQQTDGCCGVMQVYGFSNPGPAQGWEPYKAIKGMGATEQEAYQNLFNDLMARCSTAPMDDDDAYDEDEDVGLKGFVIQMWFVKQRIYDGTINPATPFLAQPLKDLIAAMPGVLCLGSTINPNSGNLIEGYQWIAN
jgi:hypothetical protein